MAGIETFLNSHTCCPLCAILDLPKVLSLTHSLKHTHTHTHTHSLTHTHAHTHTHTHTHTHRERERERERERRREGGKKEGIHTKNQNEERVSQQKWGKEKKRERPERN